MVEQSDNQHASAKASGKRWSEPGSDDGNQIKGVDKRAIKMEHWLQGKDIWK